MKIDVSVVKTKIDGKIVLLPTDEMDEFDKIPNGTLMNAEVSVIPDKRLRSYEQLRLYFASCQAVADSTEDQYWSNKKQVDEQTKIALKHYDYYVYYQNAKTGKMELNIRTKSISFAELAHLDANNYFDQAFKIHAAKIGMSVEEWVEFVHFTMKGGLKGANV